MTSLGLVQMTRKRVGAGLLEAFSTQCECCSGRGVILTLEAPAEAAHRSSAGVAAARRPIPTPPPHEGEGNGRGRGNGADPRPSNGRSGNRRSGGRSDNDWRAPAAAIASASVEVPSANVPPLSVGSPMIVRELLKPTEIASDELKRTLLTVTSAPNELI